MKTEPARVLILDDHPLFRHGLAELLSREPGIDVCTQVGDARAAWKELEGPRLPDLMIVDLRLQESEGLDLIKQVSARYPGIRLLVLSMCDEKEYAERALRAGAMGYVEKHESPDVVVRAVREVLADTVFLSPAMRERLLRRMVAPGAGSFLADLSDRELQVLDLLGQGLGTPEIARRLHLSAKTIQAHREHLKAKLAIKTAPELVHYAITRQFDGGRGASPPPRRPAQAGRVR